MTAAELANREVCPDADAVWCEDLGRWTQRRNRAAYFLRGTQLVETWDLHPAGGAR